jgi:hypothetical protein
LQRNFVVIFSCDSLSPLPFRIQRERAEANHAGTSDLSHDWPDWPTQVGLQGHEGGQPYDSFVADGQEQPDQKVRGKRE